MLKQVLRRILVVVAGFVGILALASLVLLIFGYRPFILESSSMEPLYRKGSLVWADTKVSMESIQPNDVIVYRAGGTVILHRYIGDGMVAGDVTGNPQELSPQSLVGREVFTIPSLGAVISSLASIRWIVIALVVVLVVAACLPQRKSTSVSGHPGSRDSASGDQATSGVPANQTKAESDKDGEKN